MWMWYQNGRKIGEKRQSINNEKQFTQHWIIYITPTSPPTPSSSTTTTRRRRVSTYKFILSLILNQSLLIRVFIVSTRRRRRRRRSRRRRRREDNWIIKYIKLVAVSSVWPVNLALVQFNVVGVLTNTNTKNDEAPIKREWREQLKLIAQIRVRIKNHQHQQQQHYVNTIHQHSLIISCVHNFLLSN